jgi:hypothetical protein
MIVEEWAKGVSSKPSRKPNGDSDLFGEQWCERIEFCDISFIERQKEIP